MRTTRDVLVAVLLLGSALPQVSAQAISPGERVSLKHKFRKGDAVRMTTAIDQTMEMKMSGNRPMPTVEMKQASLYEMVYHVTDVTPDGDTTLELAYERIKRTTSAGGRTMTADSKQEPNASRREDHGLWVGLKMMVGLRLTVSLDRECRVKEVKGFDALRKDVMGDKASGGPGQGGISGAIDGAVQPLYEDAFERTYGEKLLRELIDQWFTSYTPPQQVVVGESWASPDNFDVPVFGGQMMGRLRTETTNTLLGVEQHKGIRCAKVKVASPSGAFPPESFKPGPGSNAAHVKVRTSSVAGTAWFDLNGSGLVESSVKRDIAIVTQTPGGEARSGRSDATTKSDTAWTVEIRIQSATQVTASPESRRQP